MPGRNPREAVEAFIDPLREGLSCVARAKVSVSPGGHDLTGKIHSLTLNRDEPIRLRGKPLLLRIRMQYEIIPADGDRGPWRTTTHGYSHEVQSTDGQAVLSWHWHPDSKVKEPHIHVGSAQLAEDSVLSRRHHLPSERVSWESVIRLCIRELGVEPLRQDWEQALSLHEGLFKLHRSWGMYAPPAA